MLPRPRSSEKSASVRRRWWFSLRTLLVIVTISCVFLGWLGVQLRWIHERHEALRWVMPLHARQLAAQSGTSPPLRKGFYVSHAGVQAPWNLRIFGESGVERLEVDPEWLNMDAPYSLDELRSLFPEAEISSPE